jgi:hypothetical protein
MPIAKKGHKLKVLLSLRKHRFWKELQFSGLRRSRWSNFWSHRWFLHFFWKICPQNEDHLWTTFLDVFSKKVFSIDFTRSPIIFLFFGSSRGNRRDCKGDGKKDSGVLQEKKGGLLIYPHAAKGAWVRDQVPCEHTGERKGYGQWHRPSADKNLRKKSQQMTQSVQLFSFLFQTTIYCEGKFVKTIPNATKIIQRNWKAFEVHHPWAGTVSE